MQHVSVYALGCCTQRWSTTAYLHHHHHHHPICTTCNHNGALVCAFPQSRYHDTKYMMALKSPGAEEMRRVHPLVHLLPPRLQGAFMPHPEVGVSLR
jgi:hypothetical protein